MSCVFRIAGKFLDIDSLLSQCALPVCKTWRKGAPRATGKSCVNSGANLVVSNADFENFDGQLADASAYLQQHTSTIAALAALPGVEEAYLDFAVALKSGFFVKTSYLPPAFVEAIGRAGIGVAISTYTCSDDDS